MSKDGKKAEKVMIKKYFLRLFALKKDSSGDHISK